jgi:hypothetical protein
VPLPGSRSTALRAQQSRERAKPLITADVTIETGGRSVEEVTRLVGNFADARTFHIAAMLVPPRKELDFFHSSRNRR